MASINKTTIETAIGDIIRQHPGDSLGQIKTRCIAYMQTHNLPEKFFGITMKRLLEIEGKRRDAAKSLQADAQALELF
jgi:hypothetical protein